MTTNKENPMIQHMKTGRNPLFRLGLAIALAAFLGGAALAAAWPGPPEEEEAILFSSAGTTREAAADFLQALQKAVAVDDREAVAELTAFPLRAWTGRSLVEVPNASSFLLVYPGIFDPSLKALIAKATVDDVFANYQGVMIGDGRLWFSPVGDRLKIITINRPETASGEGAR